MKPEEKKVGTRIYEERLEKFGVDVRTVGWRSKHQQHARFKALCEIGDLNDKTLLDVGCGFGDLYDYLKNKGIKLKKYVGLDLSKKLIRQAKKLHAKEVVAEFRVMDVADEDAGVFDYVVASGIFNQKIEDNWGHAKLMMTKMFEASRLGLAVNMVTDYVDYKDENLFYFNPEKVFSMCKKLTKRVCLRHEYMPFEFTIYLYKDQRKNDDNVFQNWLENK